MVNPKKNEYIRNRINTAAREDLVLIVFDVLIASSSQALEKLKNAPGDIQGIHDTLRRAQLAVATLMGGLDFKVDEKFGRSTYAMYEHWHKELVATNLRKDPARLEQLVPVFREFREIWAETIRRYRLEQRRPTMERDAEGGFVAVG